MLLFLLEVDAFDPAVGAVRTLRFATTGYTTKPSDAPANAFFEPRMARPGNFERSMFGAGRTIGQGSSLFGDIELINEDGGLDGLLDLAFDGRSARLSFIADERSPWASRSVMLSGSIQQAEISEKRVILRLRDRMEELGKDLVRPLYLGTTTAGGQGTAEGTEKDLKDRPKPVAWGRVLNVPLVIANAFDNLFQGAANAVASCEAVYVAGLAMTQVGAVQTSIAGLMSVTLTGGQYAVMLNPFIVRVGGSPTQQITADFTEGATVGDRCAAQIVRRILLYAGKVEGVDFLTSDIATFAGQAPAEQGVWCQPEKSSIIEPIQAVLAGVGGYITQDRLGRFRIGQFRAPDAPPELTLTPVEILDNGQAIEVLATGDEGNGIPTAKVTVNYGLIWQVQDEQALAGAVSLDRRAFLKTETRTAVAEDAAVRLVYLLATELTFDSLIVSAADAAAEAQRQLDLRKVRRTFVSVQMPSEIAVAVDLGDVVRVAVPRLGLTAGKDFVVTRLVEEPDRAADTIATTTLELWG